MSLHCFFFFLTPPSPLLPCPSTSWGHWNLLLSPLLNGWRAKKRQFSCLLTLYDGGNQASSCRAAGKHLICAKQKSKAQNTSPSHSPDECLRKEYETGGRHQWECLIQRWNAQDLIAWPSKNVARGDRKQKKRLDRPSPHIPSSLYSAPLETQSNWKAEIHLKAYLSPRAKHKKYPPLPLFYSRANICKNR